MEFDVEVVYQWSRHSKNFLEQFFVSSLQTKYTLVMELYVVFIFIVIISTPMIQVWFYGFIQVYGSRSK